MRLVTALMLQLLVLVVLIHRPTRTQNIDQVDYATPQSTRGAECSDYAKRTGNPENKLTNNECVVTDTELQLRNNMPLINDCITSADVVYHLSVRQFELGAV